MRVSTWSGLAALGLAAMMTGCQRAETDYDPYTDFTAYTRFAWNAPEREAESATERDYPHLLADIREMVATNLVHKGLTLAEPGDADLLLTVHLELADYHTAPDANADGHSDIPSQKLGPLVLAPYSVTEMDNSDLNRELQEGTLLLNMFERESGEPVWQGWLRRVMDVENIRDVEWRQRPDASDVTYRRRMVRQAVDRLLADFPPKPKVRLSAEGRKPD
ncbi:MAG: DUF4136 domain-containing protein [Lentisphaerae bacterium]|nr:DUF4136 domain-containing protein [Lentisphaerota bacterium]